MEELPIWVGATNFNGIINCNFMAKLKLLFLNIVCGAILWMVFLSCNTTTDKNKLPLQKSGVLYKKEYNALYVNRCDTVDIPDSIRFNDVRHLAFTCSELIDFDLLSRRLDLSKIRSITIDSLNQAITNLDLNRFTSLNHLQIFGTDEVIKINIVNVPDSLVLLQLSAPNLDLPDFDAAFLHLNFFSYEGRADTIPPWIERLNQLRTFIFDSDHLTEIQCDVCKMTNITVFAIVDSDVADKEFSLKNMAVYSSIKKFRTCKPELYFWNVLPPK